MSKQALELLKALSFLTEDNQVADLDAIPESELRSRLNYYFSSRKDGAPNEAQALVKQGLANSMLLSSTSARNNVDGVTPKLLLCDSIVVDDRLFSFAAPESETARSQGLMFGFKPQDGIDRKKLKTLLEKYAGLALFIESGMLRMLPYSLPDPPSDSIPIEYSKDRYRSLVPDKVYDFVQQAVEVKPCEKRDFGLVVLDDPNPPRMRWISIAFKDDEPQTGGGLYHYTTAKSEGLNPDGSFRMVFDVFNETPLDKATYDGWVEQSVNKTVWRRMQEVGDELVLANKLGIPYVTESRFESELLSKAGVEGNAGATAPISFLDANFSFLTLEDPELVVRLRVENGDLLRRFQTSLTDVCISLQGKDERDFTDTARRLFRTEIEPQIAEVQMAISKIKLSAYKGGLITAGGIALAVITGAALPVVATLPLLLAGTIAEALPAVGKYLENRKRPEYVWYKLGRRE